jgi:hypothetical protein
MADHEYLTGFGAVMGLLLAVLLLGERDRGDLAMSTGSLPIGHNSESIDP